MLSFEGGSWVDGGVCNTTVSVSGAGGLAPVEEESGKLRRRERVERGYNHICFT